MMNLNKRVAANIKKLREAKGIKQAVLAKALNITEQYYSKIENGKCNLYLDKIEEIAQVLQVSAFSLLTDGLREEEKAIKRLEVLLNLFEQTHRRTYADYELFDQNRKILDVQNQILMLLKN